MTKPKILLIYTGGTIGMIEDPKDNRLKPFDFDHLLKELPELKKFKISISTTTFEKPIDSSNVNIETWVELVEIIEKNYNKYDGFVILHGSDTMAYTASALSFMLEGLNKPVILTGSQLPIGIIRTDGKENLITAIEIASMYNDLGQPLVPEVAIYFEYHLFRGNRTKKVSAENFDAFASTNYPPLAEAGLNINFDFSAIVPYKEEPLTVRKKMDPNIATLHLFPGITPQTIRSVLLAEHTKAIILSTYGSGNAPSHQWFIELMEEAIKEGKIIFNITQCISGKVEQGRYETSALLDEIGVVNGYDITFESAVTKMMYLLANVKNKRDILELLSVSIRGELTNV